MIVISEEAVGPSRPDVLQEIQSRAFAAWRQKQIDDLAAECGDRAFAELFYMPSAGIPF